MVGARGRAWPDYASYATRTDRLIPVFLLEREG